MAEDYYISQDENNMASILGFEIGLADEVEFVDFDETKRTFNSVNFTIGKEFLNIYVTPGKSKVKIKPKRKGGNPYYNISITVFHPKDRALAAEKLFEMARHQVIVRYKTGNGIYRLIGTHEEFGTMSVEPLNDKADGYDGYSIVVKGDYTRAPLYGA